MYYKYTFSLSALARCSCSALPYVHSTYETNFCFIECWPKKRIDRKGLRWTFVVPVISCQLGSDSWHEQSSLRLFGEGERKLTFLRSFCCQPTIHPSIFSSSGRNNHKAKVETNRRGGRRRILAWKRTVVVFVAEEVVVLLPPQESDLVRTCREIGCSC